MPHYSNITSRWTLQQYFISVGRFLRRNLEKIQILLALFTISILNEARSGFTSQSSEYNDDNFKNLSSLVIFKIQRLNKYILKAHEQIFKQLGFESQLDDHMNSRLGRREESPNLALIIQAFLISFQIFHTIKVFYIFNYFPRNCNYKNVIFRRCALNWFVSYLEEGRDLVILPLFQRSFTL